MKLENAVSRPIIISLPHQLGAAQAKENADTSVRKMFQQYGTFLSEHSIMWSGNHADVAVGALGARLKGEIDVNGERVKLTVHLPLALLPMRKKIEAFVTSNARALAPPRDI
jgi:hypothetical protein